VGCKHADSGMVTPSPLPSNGNGLKAKAKCTLSEGCTPNGVTVPKTALIYVSCVFEFLKSTYSVGVALVVFLLERGSGIQPRV
jgi:hypothetical protein